MKFIQTGDIHIGACRNLPDYLERHESVLNFITHFCVEKSLPLVIAGDLFHAKNTKHEEFSLAAKWLYDLETKKIPTIVTAGNHDHLYGSLTQLGIFNYFPFNYVKIADWEPKRFVLDNTNFICLSWQNYTTEEIESIVTGLLDTNYDNVAILHECLLGSKFDGGVSASSGCKIPNIPEVKYWAIGDIHKTQVTNVPNGWYAGAPMQFTFGDELEKGLLVVDTSKPTSPEFVRIPSKALKIVDSMLEINDDAYYMVRSPSLEETLEASKSSSVVKIDWQKSEKEAIEYKTLSITDGLVNFLAKNGIDEDYQRFGVEWVESKIKEIGEGQSVG